MSFARKLGGSIVGGAKAVAGAHAAGERRAEDLRHFPNASVLTSIGQIGQAWRKERGGQKAEGRQAASKAKSWLPPSRGGARLRSGRGARWQRCARGAGGQKAWGRQAASKNYGLPFAVGSTIADGAGSAWSAVVDAKGDPSSRWVVQWGTCRACKLCPPQPEGGRRWARRRGATLPAVQLHAEF